jgi:hypothetical protein
MKEELKKEWSEKEIKRLFDIIYNCNSMGEKDADLQGFCSDILHFINSTLAKQQETPMGYSQWVAYGKKFGYHDYLKEEFVNVVKMIMDDIANGKAEVIDGKTIDYLFAKILADIKSKLKI